MGVSMTQEEKDLLMKDLCARLPYVVQIEVTYSKDSGSSLRNRLCHEGVNTLYANILWLFQQEEIYIKPYLRPMSSMTEEEKKEFIHCVGYEVEESVNGRHYEYYLKDYVGTPETPICNYDAIDWLNAHHFDYRGLIEKDLALEAPENMYNNNSETII